MAVTPATFRSHHEPWWSTVPDAELQAAIDRAERRYDSVVVSDADVLDDLVEWAVYLEVGSGPYARDKRLPVTAQHFANAQGEIRRIVETYGRAHRVEP